MLCVRLVFCLYAEDAHIFRANWNMFHDYMEQYDTSGLNKLSYVNRDLFEREDIEIPIITDEIRNILFSKASAGFDWSDISPTIFGAVFGSTLNPETRRSGGMYYTSIENIHEIVDPLFLDDLKAELEEIKSTQEEKKNKLEAESFSG